MTVYTVFSVAPRWVSSSCRPSAACRRRSRGDGGRERATIKQRRLKKRTEWRNGHEEQVNRKDEQSRRERINAGEKTTGDERGERSREKGGARG